MLRSCSCWISFSVPLAVFACRSDGFQPHVSASDQTDGDECSGEEADPALSPFFPPSPSHHPSFLLSISHSHFLPLLSLSLISLPRLLSYFYCPSLSTFFLFPHFFIPSPSHLSSCPPVSCPAFLLSFSHPISHWFLPPPPLSLLPPLPPPPPPDFPFPSPLFLSGSSKTCYKKLLTRIISHASAVSLLKSRE